MGKLFGSLSGNLSAEYEIEFVNGDIDRQIEHAFTGHPCSNNERYSAMHQNIAISVAVVYGTLVGPADEPPMEVELNTKHCHGIYVLACASASHSKRSDKRSTATYIRKDIWERNIRLHPTEWRAANEMELAKLHDVEKSMSDLRLASRKLSVQERNAATLKLAALKVERDKLSKSCAILKNTKFPVSRANQLCSLGSSTSVALATVKASEVFILTDNKVNVPVDYVIRKDHTEDFSIKSTEVKSSDGEAMIAKSWADAHGWFEHTSNWQEGIRGSHSCLNAVAPEGNCIKGSARIIHDTQLNELYGAKDPWGNAYAGQPVCIPASVAKDYVLFESAEAWSEGGLELRIVPGHLTAKGEFCVGRQMAQSLFWGCRTETIEEMVAPQIEELKALGTPEGYAELSYREVPLLRLPGLENAAFAAPLRNSNNKVAFHALADAADFKVKVKGVTLMASYDAKAERARFSGKPVPADALKSGECRLPYGICKLLGLKLGGTIDARRYPVINLLPWGLKVVGYCPTGLIEVCADAQMGINGLDFDMDTLYVIADDRVRENAVFQLDWCEKHGIPMLYAFEAEDATEAAGAVTLSQYLAFARQNSDVGSATNPIFVLASLMPVRGEAFPTVNGEIFDYGKVLRYAAHVNADVTNRADSAKHMCLAETYKPVQKLCWYLCSFSQVFDHAGEGYKYSVHDGAEWLSHPNWINEYNRDGEKRIINDDICISSGWYAAAYVLKQVYGEGNEDVPTEYIHVVKDYVPFGEEVPDGEHPGFVYNAYGAYDGIDRRLVSLPTEADNIIKSGTRWYLDIDGLSQREVIKTRRGVVTGTEFREFVLAGLPEAEDDMSEDQLKGCVSLKPSKYGNETDLALGALYSRMTKATIWAEHEASDPRSKKEIRVEMREHIGELIQIIFWAKTDIWLDNETADRLAFNDWAGYLFSKKAYETSAGDFAVLCREFPDLLKEAWISGMWSFYSDQTEEDGIDCEVEWLKAMMPKQYQRLLEEGKVYEAARAAWLLDSIRWGDDEDDEDDE